MPEEGDGRWGRNAAPLVDGRLTNRWISSVRVSPSVWHDRDEPHSLGPADYRIVDLVAFDQTRAQTTSLESWQSEGVMSDATRAYLGSWPEFYDRLLVPVLFEPYARLLAGRLRGMTSGNVLEIAAGTGVVTRELIRTLPEAVGITATDLNQPMLDRAQSYAGAERVRWQQADALALPFGDGSFECTGAASRSQTRPEHKSCPLRRAAVGTESSQTCMGVFLSSGFLVCAGSLFGGVSR